MYVSMYGIGTMYRYYVTDELIQFIIKKIKLALRPRVSLSTDDSNFSW